MNSRDRVLTALAHKQPDRVPVDIGATPSSNISAIAYNNVKKKMGIQGGHTRVYDVCQQVILPEEWFIRDFGIDVIDIAHMWNKNDDDWVTVKLQDGSEAEYPSWFDCRKQADNSVIGYTKDGCAIGKMPVGATYFDQIVFPYENDFPENYSNLSKDMGRVTWSAFAHAPWDHAHEADFWPRLRSKTLELRQSTDKALMFVCGCNLFEWGTFLRRIDNFLMDLLSEPEEVERFLDAIMELHLSTLENACKYIGDIVDIIRFGDDLGMDSGPMMSPEIYRKIFKPRHKILCDYVKKNSSMHTFLHSCGSIYKIIPDLIEAGYDILNPIQTSAVDMEPEKLKKEFGKDIVFWGGGADTRATLNRGSAQEVKDDVKRRLEILMPGGGFVFNPVHNIMPDCPAENIIAMLETVEQYGVY